MPYPVDFITKKTYSFVTENTEISLTLSQLKNVEAAIDYLFENVPIERHFELEDLAPYFGEVWPSAIALCEHLSNEGVEKWKENSILELGCGLALPSLFLSKQGLNVNATDWHPEVESFLTENQKLNRTKISYQRSHWSDLNGSFDIILGSDLLYEERQIKTLADTLLNLSKPSTVIYLSDPGRGYLQAFSDQISKLGFTVEILPTKENLFVLKLTHF